MLAYWLPVLSNKLSSQLTRTAMGLTPLWKMLPDFPIRWWNPVVPASARHDYSVSPIYPVSLISSISPVSNISDMPILGLTRHGHEDVASVKLPPILKREHDRPNNVTLPSLSELGLLNFGRSHDYDAMPMIRPPPFTLLPSLSSSQFQSDSASDCSSETTLEDALEKLSLSDHHDDDSSWRYRRSSVGGRL